MKASKHRPVCPQGRSLHVLTQIESGKPCQGEGRTLTHPGEEHLLVVGVTVASPTQV